MIRDVLSAAVGIFLVLTMAVVQAQAPTTMNYQGRLLLKADQQAVDINVVIVFTIWTGPDSNTEATELWSETWNPVPVSNRIFSVMLGSNGTPLDPVDFYNDSSVYLQLVIEEETLLPRQQLGSVPFAMGYQTRETYQDCPQCPLMINIPGGSFERGVGDTVTVPAFAMGVYEVTWDVWDACVAAMFCDVSGAVTSAGGDEGYGKGARPVINVNWDDTQDYISWLNSTTSGGYRLPSESEWEYATRAGTDTDYWFGDDIGDNQANCSQSSNPNCGDPFDNTAPVHTFSANPFGLYNVHGNVWEWVADCWNATYDSAPSDGSAWLTGNCSQRVLRGGSWLNDPTYLRSVYRGWDDSSDRDFNFGFRIAQDQN